MIEQLRTAIKNKLDTLTGTWQPISVVYEYMTSRIDWYPCAMIDFNTLSWEHTDSCNNKRTYSFWIYILQETKLQTKEQGYRAVENIIVKIADAFDKDPQLWWLANNILAVWWDISEYNNGSDWEYIWWIVKLDIETIYFLWE